MSLSQLRMCSTPLKLTQQQKNIIYANMPGSQKLQMLRAVSLKNKIWPEKSVIYITFVGPVPIDISLRDPEALAKRLQEPILDGFKHVSYLDPNNNQIDSPYIDANGNMIDQNNNPILFDPLEKPMYDQIEAAQNLKPNPSAKTKDADKFKKEIQVPLVVRKCVETIIKNRFEPYLNLTFLFQANPKTKTGDIRISFDPETGCWSYIGIDCLTIPKDKATMNLGWFSVCDVMHEFGHALGLDHEHKKPDRDNQFLFNLPLLYKWAKMVSGQDEADVNWNIVDKLNQDQINDITFFKNKNQVVHESLFEFDPSSIMLYFYPAEITVDPLTGGPGKGTPANRRLSTKDVMFLNALYPGDGVSGIRNQKVGRITPDQFYFKTYKEHLEPWNKIILVFKTSNESYSGTDSQVVLKMIDRNGKDFIRKLDNTGNDFERNQTDTYIIETPEINRDCLDKPIVISLQGRDDWKLEKLSIYYVKGVQRGAHPPRQFIKSYTPDIWLGDGKGSVESITLTNNYNVKYIENNNIIKFVFKTTNAWYSGTDSQVIVSIYDPAFKGGANRPFNLDNPGNDFERGKTDTYSLKTDIPKSSLTDKPIVLSLEGGDDWNVEKISIYYNGEFIKSYTPPNGGVWLGDGSGSVKSIILENNNYGINLRENFQLGFDPSSDATGFWVTIGLMVLFLALLASVAILYMKKK